MKIMTINTHSLAEPEYEKKREWFLRVMLREMPEILAMQEVNQSVQAPELAKEELPGYAVCPGQERPVRADNHAAWLAGRLAKRGCPYYWTWLPAKLGYGKFDEGVALFSRSPIRETDFKCISRAEDYQNWKTRKVLGIRTDEGWYYTVHMGWWDDEEEPYRRQWQVLDEHLQAKKMDGLNSSVQRQQDGCPVWLMGDFNSPAGVRGQGYDLVCESGWYDTYVLAAEKDCGVTVEEEIDGWRDRPVGETDENEPDGTGQAGNAYKGMRIDHIFCSRPEKIVRSQVVCNGRKDPRVSDHYGVMIETEEDN